MFSRVLGIVLVFVGVFGLLISVGGVLVSSTVIEQLNDSLETTLSLASDSLDTVEDTLQLTKTSVNQAGASIDTLAETAVNVSTTMSDTQPLLNAVTESATQQIPESIESIQEAIPNVAEAAGAIDDTLRVLDSFSLDRQVFGIPLQFDLGVDYQPTAPLDETVLDLRDSLDGVPDDLRALESDMVLASDNLAIIGSNIETVAGDLESISQTVDQINPLLDDYLEIVAQTQTLITQAQTDLGGQLRILEWAVIALFVWLGLNQIVPLYLGWTMITDDDDEAGEASGSGQSTSTKTQDSAAGEGVTAEKGGEDARDPEADES